MKFKLLIAFGIGLFLSGCNNTVGNIELRGKVIDKETKTVIPNISVIIEAIDQALEIPVNTYAGDFTTDSSGCFTYTLKKIKNVSLYNFCIKGDPDYDPTNVTLGLTDLNKNGKFLVFEVNRLADFMMYIDRKNKTTYRDTLIVSWETNGVNGKTIYPFKIENYRINPENCLLWVGGEVNSVVKTKVYADKNTIVHWKLFRNGKQKDFIDTVFCKRDVNNNEYFTY